MERRPLVAAAKHQQQEQEQRECSDYYDCFKDENDDDDNNHYNTNMNENDDEEKQQKQEEQQHGGNSRDGGEIYLIPYAHLDTQWRWEYPTTIRRYIANTLDENFVLMSKYPEYCFNFTGSLRYEMMKEYYPTEYESRLKPCVTGSGGNKNNPQQQWHVAGTCLDETDVLLPCCESMIRNILYGNEYIEREFGKDCCSRDYMIPDCFGFPANMPTIMNHCNLNGFSTQKLTWGSANGIPFDIGIWNGPEVVVDDNNSDTGGIPCAFNPCDYMSVMLLPIQYNYPRKNRCKRLGDKTGVYKSFQYYGVGDIGGAPYHYSVRQAIKSIRISRRSSSSSSRIRRCCNNNNNNNNHRKIIHRFRYFWNTTPRCRRRISSILCPKKTKQKKNPAIAATAASTNDNTIRVRQGSATQFFNELTPQEKRSLERYSGDLLLTNHSAGTLTSAAIMKRWNRRNEKLGMAVECGAATLLLLLLQQQRGNSNNNNRCGDDDFYYDYPYDKILWAYKKVIGNQMHDILPGTSTPMAYEYSQNDEVLALNLFSSLLDEVANKLFPLLQSYNDDDDDGGNNNTVSSSKNNDSSVLGEVLLYNPSDVDCRNDALVDIEVPTPNIGCFQQLLDDTTVTSANKNHNYTTTNHNNNSNISLVAADGMHYPCQINQRRSSKKQQQKQQRDFYSSSDHHCANNTNKNINHNNNKVLLLSCTPPELPSFGWKRLKIIRYHNNSHSNQNHPQQQQPNQKQKEETTTTNNNNKHRVLLNTTDGHDIVMENTYYRITVRKNDGCIYSIYSKPLQREVLQRPLAYELQRERPTVYPAWNMDWKDRKRPPKHRIETTTTTTTSTDHHHQTNNIQILESGPLRCILEITTRFRNSKFIKQIGLTSDSDVIEFQETIHWNETGYSLKLALTPTVLRSSSQQQRNNKTTTTTASVAVTYNWETSRMERPVNHSKCFEHPSRYWADMSTSGGRTTTDHDRYRDNDGGDDRDNHWGISILEDCKYGYDRPTEDTLRLTLLYTPSLWYLPLTGMFDQTSQDWGKHTIKYGLYVHKGNFGSQQRPQTTIDAKASCLNQPIRSWYYSNANTNTSNKTPDTKHEKAGSALSNDNSYHHHPYDNHHGPPQQEGQPKKKKPDHVSLLSLSTPQIGVMAIKGAQDQNGIIVRLYERYGKVATGCVEWRMAPIARVQEVNGLEEEIVASSSSSSSHVLLNENRFQVTIPANGLKSFRIVCFEEETTAKSNKDDKHRRHVVPNTNNIVLTSSSSNNNHHSKSKGGDRDCVPLSLPCNEIMFSKNGEDNKNGIFPRHLLPATISRDRIEFRLNKNDNNSDNKFDSLYCCGQTIHLPNNDGASDHVASSSNNNNNSCRYLYVLSGAYKNRDNNIHNYENYYRNKQNRNHNDEDLSSSSPILWYDRNDQEIVVARNHNNNNNNIITKQYMTGYLGQWDQRIWKRQPRHHLSNSRDYVWLNKCIGVEPGFVKRPGSSSSGNNNNTHRIEWFTNHIHDSNGNDLPYQYGYMFSQIIEIPTGAVTFRLPRDHELKLFAATVAAMPKKKYYPAAALANTYHCRDEYDF